MLYSKKGQPFALPEGESMPQDNALEFISAYNIIDARLRTLYRGKGNLNFSDLVRRCADHNPVVRKYEDDLVFCAKLRNVIVHTTTTDRVVAEPCDEITQLMTHVAELLSSPPRLKLLKDKQVTGISAKETVEEALIRIAKSDYSNLPVYRGEKPVGMLNNRRLVRAIGSLLSQGGALEELLALPCEDILREEDIMRYYRVLGKETPIQDAVDAFAENRKLLAVIVTHRGNWGEPILNILTSSDIPRLLKYLED